MAALELLAEIALEGLPVFLSGMDRAADKADQTASIFDTAMKSIGAAGAAALGIMAAFTTSAVQEATKIEMLTTQFGVLRGSIDAGAQSIRTIRAFAHESLNTFDSLAAGMRKIESAGVNSARFLPIIDLLATMKGGGAQSVMEFADAVARISSGANMGMAMRLFSGVGIGYADLRAQGVKVSKGNHIESGPAEVLEAIQRITETKFHGMREALSKTMTVAFSDIQDAWAYLLDSFGKAWFPLIRGILSSVTPFVEFLAASGEANKIAKGFADAFSAVFGAAGGGNTVVTFLTYLVTTMEMLPTMITTAGKALFDVGKTVFAAIDKMFTGFVNNSMNAFLEVANFVRPIVAALFNAVLAAERVLGRTPLHDDAVKIVEKMRDPIQVTPFKGMGDMLQRALDPILNGDALGKIPGEFHRRQLGMMAEYEKYLGQPHPSEDHSKDPLFNALHLKDSDALGKIADNSAAIAGHTKAVADHFKKYTLGGGDRGQAGISVAEFYGSNGGRMRIDTGKAATMFEKAVAETVQEYHTSMRRALLGAR